MEKNLKQKLKDCDVTIGSWITLAHTGIAEIMANAGFDWLTIDMEHSAIGINEAQLLIQTIDLCDCTPLVRLSSNDPVLIKRVMDAGSHGVIVPMVNSAEDALKAVAAVRYPPAGIRGVGLARAQGYGARFDEYCEWLKESAVVVAQVEHIDAVNNLEAIIEVEGIDALIVGPYDLSGSLGLPGAFNEPSVLNALEHVEKIAKEKGIAFGCHVIEPDVEEVLDRIDSGYTFLAYSLDIMFLGKSCRNGLARIRSKKQG